MKSISPTVSQVFPTKDNFILQFNELGLGTDITEAELSKFYVYFIARYGGANIRYLMPEIYTLNVFVEIDKHWPMYKYKLKMQEDLLQKSIDDLRLQSKVIANAAANPNMFNEDELGPYGELKYTNSQQSQSAYDSELNTIYTTNRTAISWLWDDFLSKFQKLIVHILVDQDVSYYEEEE